MARCTRPHLTDPRTYLDEPEQKQVHVTRLFNLIAARYDRFTRWFSYGMDTGWKDYLVAHCLERTDARLALDAACGTGDIMHRLHTCRPRTLLLGLDPSEAMLDVARMRFRSADNVQLLKGNLMSLPVAGGTLDLVTVSYGFRNTPDWKHALRQVHRALAPGGVLGVLDFYLPDRPLWRILFLHYLSLMGRIYGLLLHGDPRAYGYIAASVERYVTCTQFSDALRQTGFGNISRSRRLLGGVAIHVATRI